MASLYDSEAWAGAFAWETTGESAASLGRSGRRVEESLAALRTASGPQRAERLKEAVEAVYYYFIQRELLGAVDHEKAIALYDIPEEVLLRLGTH